MLDQFDLDILDRLQKNAQITNQDLGETLGLSPSQAGRRRQKLEQLGYIARYRAELAPEKFGLMVQAFVQVQMATHAPDEVAIFVRQMRTTREVITAFTMTGEADYLLHICCQDLQSLNRFVRDIILPIPAVARVQSQIVLDQLKAPGPLPI